MATAVIMPALELAQETGKVVRWLKASGEAVTKGEPLIEIETDKVTVEIEATASGILADVTAREGDVVPVGQTIALIAAPGEAGLAPAVPGLAGGTRQGAASGLPARAGADARSHGERGLRTAASATGAPTAGFGPGRSSELEAGSGVKASPLARRIAEEHGVDIAQVTPAVGDKIQKADVLAHLARWRPGAGTNGGAAPRLVAASPRARRLAAERGLDVSALAGSGPGGAVLAADVAAAPAAAGPRGVAAPPQPVTPEPPARVARDLPREEPPGERVGTVWRIMAERMTASWTTAPHFYLVREVDVTRLAAWRERASKQTGTRITYTDLLVKLVAAALVRHPRANVSWKDGALARHAEINVGIAVAVEEGLIVPVIHRADTLGLADIAARREDVVARGQAGKLRPADIQGGTFTISNLGMYGVDAFNAIVNPPQAAILAVGRIADRVVPIDGQPAVRPTMVLTLSCDHRAIDGARAAQFLSALADLIEEPLTLLV